MAGKVLLTGASGFVGRAVQARLESGASTDPKPARPAEGRGAVPVQAFARAARFLAAYARYVFGREPKMMTTLFGHKLPR